MTTIDPPWSSGKKDIRRLGLNFSTPMKFANFMTTTRNYRNCIQEVTSLFNPNRVTSSLLACYVFSVLEAEGFIVFNPAGHVVVESSPSSLWWPRDWEEDNRDANKTKEQQTAVHRSITFPTLLAEISNCFFFRNLRKIHWRRETAGNWHVFFQTNTFQGKQKFRITSSKSTKGHCSRWRAWWHSWTSH